LSTRRGGRIVELRAFVASGKRSLVFVGVSLSDLRSPLSFLGRFDVPAPSARRQSPRQMKALFRRIDKINRVAHDNADNFATIRARPGASSHARVNTRSQETRAKNQPAGCSGLLSLGSFCVSSSNNASERVRDESARDKTRRNALFVGGQLYLPLRETETDTLLEAPIVLSSL